MKKTPKNRTTLFFGKNFLSRQSEKPLLRDEKNMAEEQMEANGDWQRPNSKAVSLVKTQQ